MEVVKETMKTVFQHKVDANGNLWTNEENNPLNFPPPMIMVWEEKEELADNKNHLIAFSTKEPLISKLICNKSYLPCSDEQLIFLEQCLVSPICRF